MEENVASIYTVLRCWIFTFLYRSHKTLHIFLWWCQEIRISLFKSKHSFLWLSQLSYVFTSIMFRCKYLWKVWVQTLQMGYHFSEPNIFISKDLGLLVISYFLNFWVSSLQTWQNNSLRLCICFNLFFFLKIPSYLDLLYFLSCWNLQKLCSGSVYPSSSSPGIAFYISIILF